MSVLIVGDGDFSFTKSIVKYVKPKYQFDIISTCYESYDEIIKKYSQVSDNIDYIKENGVSIMTNIDATNLSQYQFCIEFDLIIFNFPHIGGKSNIKNNRNLLYNFFKSVKNSKILNNGGLVCVSLCQGQAGTNIDIIDRIYGNSWQIEDMAGISDFLLYDIRLFDLSPFGDYIPTGFRSQEKRFRLDGARTYVFKENYVDKSDKLIAKINFNGEKFWITNWINEYFNIKNSNEKWNYVMESLTLEGFSEYEWCYVNDSTFHDGYPIVNCKKMPDKPEIISKTCIMVEKFPLDTHKKLCSSPWQQVVNIINKNSSNAHLLSIATCGECFHTCSQKSFQSVTTYLVTVQNDNYQDISTNIITSLNENELKLLSDNQIDIIHLSETQFMDIPSLQARIKHNNQTNYLVNIVNISEFLSNNYNISTENRIFPLSEQSLLPLNAIFPIYYSSQQLQLPQFFKIENEQIRLLAQRTKLDFHIFCDMSFWWPNEDYSIEKLLDILSEICRSIFLSHQDGVVTLVDDYRHPNSNVRSICVRLPMKSGLVPLSRSKMNQLQSIVRIHCQQLLDVQLR